MWIAVLLAILGMLSSLHMRHLGFTVQEAALSFQVTARKSNDQLGPNLLGDPPKINVTPPETVAEDDDDSSSDGLPAIKIYDDDVNMKFLVCGERYTLVSSANLLFHNS